LDGAVSSIGTLQKSHRISLNNDEIVAAKL
jgi:hypothetical protein